MHRYYVACVWIDNIALNVPSKVQFNDFQGKVWRRIWKIIFCISSHYSTLFKGTEKFQICCTDTWNFIRASDNIIIFHKNRLRGNLIFNPNQLLKFATICSYCIMLRSSQCKDFYSYFLKISRISRFMIEMDEVY